MVTFDSNVKVFNMRVWPYAYNRARIGEWQQMAVDRFRFQRRINETSEKISRILTAEHRQKMFSTLSDSLR